MSKPTTIFCSFRQTGMHKWDTAPDAYAYLRQLHRHEFHVRVEVMVNHDDRDVEFCDLKGQALAHFQTMADSEESYSHLSYGTRSCEMLADQLAACLEGDGLKVSSVEVSEDGENGAKIVR